MVEGTEGCDVCEPLLELWGRPGSLEPAPPSLSASHIHHAFEAQLQRCLLLTCRLDRGDDHIPGGLLSASFTFFKEGVITSLWRCTEKPGLQKLDLLPFVMRKNYEQWTSRLNKCKYILWFVLSILVTFQLRRETFFMFGSIHICMFCVWLRLTWKRVKKIRFKPMRNPLIRNSGENYFPKVYLNTVVNHRSTMDSTTQYNKSEEVTLFLLI
jgi:hypothetical protein